MSLPENYILQSESLEPFNKAVAELQSISNENKQLKNSIVGEVDGLINQLNKGHTDHSEVINKLNLFIKQFDDTYEPIVTNEENQKEQKIDSIGKNEDDYEGDDETQAQLLQQNAKLKEILNQKLKYNQELDEFSQEYQQAIDKVMWDIRDTKSKNDEFKFKNFQRINKQIEEYQREEFEIFEKLVYNNHILSKLSQILVKFSKSIIDDDYTNEVEISKHLSTLERLKYEILEDKSIHHREVLQKSQWAQRAKNKKNFIPSSSNSSLSDQEFPSLGETHMTGVLNPSNVL
ncbi:Tetratricopeptide repeat protein [Wickerhamomyces ciferrii]|uniref:Tetratricopeptide repeat protein n=1 Tax=Wickerhamomyces ciferrii (strain ATCC 14091 / BCRC 22168 / CBS 111 / JCM 3599 / NBRC 0793 / NRRL Y-1031 F-60-10) TaxID=1206466 RepID=K0KMQ2_WICCF|nr:Tetratricopeptide repeat protein [Wickerhamomyces ciferrii]CCH43487.1 Tetratricopeptide repeat protein [Wickerhamomyces ciferrii]